jgi:hypothetical protein
MSNGSGKFSSHSYRACRPSRTILPIRTRTPAGLSYERPARSAEQPNHAVCGIAGFQPASPLQLQRLLRIVYRTSLVIAAMRAGPMRLFHLVTVRALCQRRRSQVVVRPSCAGPSLRMSPFWIWHFLPPFSVPLFPLLPLRHLLQYRSLRYFVASFPGTSLLLTNTHISWRYRRISTVPLLFLEPVLLNPREGSEPRITGAPFAAALFVIQVGSARRAQPPAIALADHFHWQRQ